MENPWSVVKIPRILVQNLGAFSNARAEKEGCAERIARCGTLSQNPGLKNPEPLSFGSFREHSNPHQAELSMSLGKAACASACKCWRAAGRRHLPCTRGVTGTTWG